MIALINPRATEWRCRIPISILSIGASLEGTYEYEVLDGNVDRNLESTLANMIRERSIRYVGFTVMPGPQLRLAILLSKMVRHQFPAVRIIWGGYFPTLHTNVVLRSSYVDFVIRDQGDRSFRRLIEALEMGGDLSAIPGLSYVQDGEVRHNQKESLLDPNALSPLPYHKLNISPYIGRTYLGSRTINYHSSVGCPFLCGFCAVASVYKARWLGLTPERIADDLHWFKKHFHVNAVEFHDNNFFTSERRTAEFSERILGSDIGWWGEARPDTMMQYDDATWKVMKRAGCKMIFFGAESSSQHVLKLMNKGGTQTPDTVLALVERMKSHDIIPELSFVLGSPTNTIEEDLERDMRYIRKIKEINRQTEIILYTFSPVHYDESELFEQSKRRGFRFPETLDDWLSPEWQSHDLRKHPSAPWLTPRILRRIKNFERVLNSYAPTNSDLKLTHVRRRAMQFLGSWRYNTETYGAPYELALMQRLFRYRQPEIEGF
jgi:anaerobic magnesium-protoporphyrin IX monomethyl ester cyclase